MSIHGGGIAQLEEHLLCTQGVVGSSPITSTNSKFEVRSTKCELHVRVCAAKFARGSLTFGGSALVGRTRRGRTGERETPSDPAALRPGQVSVRARPVSDPLLSRRLPVLSSRIEHGWQLDDSANDGSFGKTIRPGRLNIRQHSLAFMH